ncbi:GntR family transcriptional regulator [Christensenella tenuis]|jgi:DNA-binding LacI/PurR family transcriptional regulator|uniref:GntR family transcriptional regulator n=1 Tax=Christensenella tenuis TaxID=2763033 RepID=A0ABR7EI63_9FIRM|nr:GntR family transcriptional regulator [Christensenella tenuis]MBC5649465.1 GntR family transcriptional regulator [Christensenella tenuis]
MNDDLLYIELRNALMRKIYDGVYAAGEPIPSERSLSELYGLSRVTVRKALHLLAQQGVIHKQIGVGNTVSLERTSYLGTLDQIALVAPAQRTFFSLFLDHFQKIAGASDALVFFIQQSERERIEDTLFRLLLHGIHNCVIWLDYKILDPIYIERLRVLGMNLVFFDIPVSTPYADNVILDNRDAIHSLCRYLEKNGKPPIAYVGRENTSPTSFFERECAFSSEMPHSVILHIPWFHSGYLAEHMNRFIWDTLYPRHRPGSLLCSDGEIGVALKKALLHHGINDILVASIDDLPEAKELPLTVYSQPYHLFARQVFDCLATQNSSADWQAKTYRIKGELIVR